MSLLEHNDTAAALTAVRSPFPPDRLPSAQLSPPEQLHALLQHYRKQDTDFDTAWQQSYARIRWPKSRRDASDWRYGIEGTMEGWRAAYKRWAPEPREEAVALLSRLLEEALREDEDYELAA